MEILLTIIALALLLLVLLVILGLGLAAYHLWPRDIRQSDDGTGVDAPQYGYADALYGADPTDGIIPDDFDPMFVGAQGGSGVGFYIDGDISQLAVPEDELLPPPDTPTIMPDGSIVVNGEVIRPPGGEL